MTAAAPPSEQELHDYIDGRLDRDRRAEVAAYLAGHPSAAALIEAYRAQGAGLHALYDKVLEEPVPPAMKALLRRHRAGNLRRWLTAAAAMLLLLLSGMAGWWLNDLLRGAPPLVAEARQAYRLYAGDGRWASDVAGGDGAPALAQTVSGRVGATVDLPDLGVAGFTLRTVRMLPAPEGAAAALIYRDGRGRAAVLFVAPSRAAEAPLRRSDAGGTTTLSRVTQGVFYGLTVPRDTVGAVVARFGRTPD